MTNTIVCCDYDGQKLIIVHKALKYSFECKTQTGLNLMTVQFGTNSVIGQSYCT